MKEHIDFPKVEKVGVCAVPKTNEGMSFWEVHLINMLDVEITNLLISMRGYGKKDERELNTSQLRQYVERLGAKTSIQVELIPEELVGLNNQYWVSFYIDQTIYDKKFIFLPDSLLEKNTVELPILKKRGILII
ncbi:MAG: hypothetical protein WEC59_12000 [Salibacteraceae bacterium]